MTDQPAAVQLATEFVRDLCVCTEAELRSGWGGVKQIALEHLGVDFESQVAGHDPLYYIALRYWFDNVADDPRYLHAPLHRDILCAGLADHTTQPPSGTGLCIFLPRDTFKSTFTHGVLPMFFVLRQKRLFNRDARVALLHHKEAQASVNLCRLRDKSLYHDRFRADWPELSADRYYGTTTQFDWPWKDKGRTAEPSVVAIGLGGRMVGWHFDLMAYSDMVTDEHITSRVVREQAKSKYEASRFMLDANGYEVVDGTFYHVNDLNRRLFLANTTGQKLYHIICRPGLVDGEPLHPGRLSKEILERRRQEELARTGSDLLYHLQYMLDVKSARATIGDREKIRYEKLDQVPPDAWRIILCDPAWKGTKNAGKGDYAAIATIALERRGGVLVRHVLDLWCSNDSDMQEGAREIFRQMRHWSVVDVAPEEHGGYTFRAHLETEAAAKGLSINILDLVSKQTSKEERMATFVNEINLGRVYVNQALKGADAFEEFLVELDDAPQSEPNDLIDACAYSCDPEIVSSYAPALPANASGWRLWMPQHQEELQRTRYCGM